MSMVTAHVNAMVWMGLPQARHVKMKEAGDRITSARQLLGTHCGGYKDTSKKGHTIWKTFKEHIIGTDVIKEEDAKNYTDWSSSLIAGEYRNMTG